MKSAIALVAIAALPMLSACDRPPQPPDKSAPPEPQVEVALHEPARTPTDRTKRVQAQIDEAARQQRMAIEAAGG